MTCVWEVENAVFGCALNECLLRTGVVLTMGGTQITASQKGLHIVVTTIGAFHELLLL